MHQTGHLLPKNRRIHLITADVLFDIHSLLTAQCLLKSWRVSQLADGLTTALSQWNLTVAATIARALVETACAWTIESRGITSEWTGLKRGVVNSAEDAMRVRKRLIAASAQVAWGTRLSDALKRSQKVQRTNVLTLIQKAEKQCTRPHLFEDYEILCDAVHPSWGASECFWSETGLAAELRQMRVLIRSDAVGWLGATDDTPVKAGSALAEVLISCSAWALETLAKDLPSFDQVCRDLCLTARVYLLSNLDYWQIVRPTGTYEMCACGSGRKTRFCPHEFGSSAAS